MRVLLDTNILLRAVDLDSTDYVSCRSALTKLSEQANRLCFLPQNLIEFWNVCTRPLRNNGLGLSLVETNIRATFLENSFDLLPDVARIHTTWRRLVLDYEVSGVQVHDARIVAAMMVHGVPRILTLNTRDFARYPAIAAIHPRDLVTL